jgi:hypothetical protein
MDRRFYHAEKLLYGEKNRNKVAPEVRVRTYSGYKADERPLRFDLLGRELFVREIVKRWYGERCDFFTVMADDGENYLLTRDRQTDTWYARKTARGRCCRPIDN